MQAVRVELIVKSTGYRWFFGCTGLEDFCVLLGRYWTFTFIEWIKKINNLKI